MRNTVLKVNKFCQTLKVKVPEEHYLLIQKSRENEFVKKKGHFICAFSELQTTSSKKKKKNSKLQPHMLNQALSTLQTLH